jgi:hypothetical protein
MADREHEITKDSWFLQGIGATQRYGNGDGALVHIGRVPSGNTDPDWKSRGVFEVPLRGDAVPVLDGLTGFTGAEIELTVAGESCLVGGRGNNFYAFLEEITTTDFSERIVEAGDCAFEQVSGGGSSGGWGADSGAVTTNRAFISAPGLVADDKVTWNVNALLQTKLADTDALVLRFRVIFANSTGTTYDESTGAPRATAFYTREDATTGNRPMLRILGVSSGTSDKASSDTFVFAESHEVIESDSGTVNVADTFSFNDAHISAGEIPLWTTVVNAAGAGKGTLTLPRVSMSSSALLADVDEQDVIVRCKWSINKVPSAQSALWGVVARAQSDNVLTTYVCVAACQNAGATGITLSIYKYVAGTLSVLASAVFVRALLSDTDYWLEFLAQGATPTTLAARVWRDNESKPGAYQISAQDSEATLQTTGAVGLQGSITAGVGNVPITFSFDDFVVVAP